MSVCVARIRACACACVHVCVCVCSGKGGNVGNSFETEVQSRLVQYEGELEDKRVGWRKVVIKFLVSQMCKLP